MSNPKHKPTDEQRKTVKAMLGFGIKQEDVAKVIGVDPKTLRLHYPHEIDTAQVEANAAVAQSLFRNATKKDNVAAQIFWLKTRAQWKEPIHLANAEDGKPFLVATGVPRAGADQDDRSRLSGATAVRGVPRAS